MFLCSRLLLSFSALAHAAPFLQRDNTIPLSVDLGYTKYEGQVFNVGVGIKQWLGMRFAAPPTGELRWRAPVDPVVNNTVQSAKNFGPVCIGVGQTIGPELNEDCLFINIFSPANATENSKLPVWFYIQGGGYSGDTNNNYNGTDIINRSGGNLVFAQINYRVGAFGFLASERVRDDGDLNVGFLDQRKALEWVQKYISKFGGDPGHVAIHGDSAGAGSVAMHLVAYGGRDDHLFAGGVGESVFFPTQRKVSELEFQFKNFLKDTGCASASDSMACLRSKDLLTLQNASSTGHPYPGAASPPIFPYSPCIDGDLLKDYPNILFAEGKFVKVPVMIGDDTDEGTGFAANASSPQEVSTFMHNNYPGLTHSDLLQINKIYPLMPPLPKHAAYFPSAEKAYGEVTFICPGILISDSVSKYYGPTQVWNYRYNVLEADNVENGLGVPHVFETPAIFGLGLSGAQYGEGTSYANYNSAVVPEVMDYWIHFVRYLNPNSVEEKSTGPYWSTWVSGNDRQRIVIQTNMTRMETVPRNQRERCQFWQELTSHTET
ncbi:alpha/beta-hydrolase [Mollisia scopiformis]|uniref:Carboxylic ester hydrolase n=1 Tax=Mollisia scopiformis TaxID=149040 RepID=A0A194XWG4_MOLSC|nr:alpha/beta-hydrolase [Mollisia scopiformis]KUJ24640.1 alpha/beta-hydrolase [Mollisia scopiformis]